jgi:putative DNA primase/helicase
MRIEAALKRSVCHMFASAVSMDADSWLLNCTNGTLNLKTVILQPARPQDLITKMASVDYDVEASCALWERTLLSVCCDDLELVRYMQRVFGYALTGQTTEQVMFIFNGSGSNGKDTILNRIKKIMGSYAGLAAPSLLMVSRGSRHPTETADLFSIRLAIASESNENGRLNETLIKQLTGSEKLKARKMRQDFFEFPALFKLVLMTNHRPVIEGSDYAIWRRIHLVPFNAVYKKGVNRDDTLPARLDQELPGILRWCVQGCLEWQRIGLQPPEVVQQATQQYKADQDVLAQFFDEKCVIKPQAQVTAKTFYSTYEQWCSENGERSKSQTWLWPKLQERGIEKDKTRMGMNYRGIGLLNKDEV